MLLILFGLCLQIRNVENQRSRYHLCIGVGVISAAVMSSADSSLLSSSSLIARNIWSKFIRPGCGEFEVLRVLWAFTFINCGLATLLALQYKSVYEL